MRPLFALVLMLMTVSPVLAGNARTDRTAQTFRQDQARRAYQNYQWAQHFAAQRQDVRNAQQFPNSPDRSRLGAMRYYSRQYWNNWQQRTSPRPTVGYRR